MKLFIGIAWMVLFGFWLYQCLNYKRVTSIIMTILSLSLGIYYILQWGGIA